jgi:hypothetical protein
VYGSIQLQTADYIFEDKGHLPDFESHDGLKDLIVFACGIELQNAICPLSYQPTDDSYLVVALFNNGLSPLDALQRFDVSSSTHEMRIQNVHSRGRTISLLKGIFSRITVLDMEGTRLDPWTDLFIPTLAWFIHAIKAYAGVVEPSYLQLFVRQLEWTSKRWPELFAASERLSRDATAPSSLLWPDYPQVTVSRPTATCDLVHDNMGSLSCLILLPFTNTDVVTGTDSDQYLGDLEESEIALAGMRAGDTMYFSCYTHVMEHTRGNIKISRTRSPSLSLSHGT